MDIILKGRRSNLSAAKIKMKAASLLCRGPEKRSPSNTQTEQIFLFLKIPSYVMLNHILTKSGFKVSGGHGNSFLRINFHYAA